MARKGGFTLLELIVVVATLGLIAAAAAAKLQGFFGVTRLEVAARALADHFAFAIHRAYLTGRYHTLVIDLTKSAYWIKEGRESEGEAEEFLKRTLPRGVTFVDIQVGENSYKPPGVLSIEISPLGVTNDLLVNLCDRQGQEASVWLNSLVQSLEFFREHKNYEDFRSPTTF